MCNDTYFLQHTVTVGVSSHRKPYSAWHFFPLPACSHSDSLWKPSICYRLWLMALLIAVLCHEDTYTLHFEHIYFLRWLEKAVNRDSRRHSFLTYLCAVQFDLMTSECSFATNLVFCAQKSFAFCFKHAHICCNSPNAQLLKVDDVILTGSPSFFTNYNFAAQFFPCSQSSW